MRRRNYWITIGLIIGLMILMDALDGLELESIEIETPAGSVDEEPIDEGTTNPSIQKES